MYTGKGWGGYKARHIMEEGSVMIKKEEGRGVSDMSTGQGRTSTAAFQPQSYHQKKYSFYKTRHSERIYGICFSISL